MQLPIDVSGRPFKQKYVDEETPMLATWFIFGEYPDGTVGITDGTVDVFERVPRDMAERMVAARRVFVEAIQREIS